MHYISNTKSLFYRGLCMSWENMGQNFSYISKSDYYNLQKKSCQASS